MSLFQIGFLALVFVGAFFTSYMLARLLGWMEQTTWLGGMRVGFYLWLCIVAPICFQFAVFSGKPMGLRLKMFGIQAFHYLVVFMASGALVVYIIRHAAGGH